MVELRVGCGLDVHAFGSPRPLLLGGVEVPYRRGLDGHSDADVLTHAVIDALLGAAGLGDLGERFGTDRPEYCGVSSLTLLQQVMDELRQLGWAVVNVDATVLAQEPRLSNHRSAMRTCLARLLDVDSTRVSVKATTPDHLGAIGRAEGIAAQAVVLLQAQEQPPSAAQRSDTISAKQEAGA